MSEEVKPEEGKIEEVKAEENAADEVTAETPVTEAVETKEVKAETEIAEDAKNKTSHSGMRKTRVGKVLSNKMDKTIIVSEEKKVMHPIYKKYYKKTTKFAAHDPQNTCDIGDKVKIMETRPLSKTKRWRLVEIVEKVK